MVPDLIWAPDFFGPQEIWALRNLGPEKVGPCMKIIIWHFHARTKYFSRTNFLWDQISRGPNFSGTKKAMGPNEIGDHFSPTLVKKSSELAFFGNCYTNT
jgi:hypothetical protein